MKQILLLLACASITNTTIFGSQNPKNICGEFTTHALLHAMIDTHDMNTKKAEKIINNCRYNHHDDCELFHKALIKNRQDLMPLLIKLETNTYDKPYYKCSMTPFIANARTHPDPVGMARLLYNEGYRIQPVNEKFNIPYKECTTILPSPRNPACNTFNSLENQYKMEQKKAAELLDQQNKKLMMEHLKKIDTDFS